MQTILGLAETTKLPTTAPTSKADGRVLDLRLPEADVDRDAAPDLPNFTAVFGEEVAATDSTLQDVPKEAPEDVVGTPNDRPETDDFDAVAAASETNDPDITVSPSDSPPDEPMIAERTRTDEAPLEKRSEDTLAADKGAFAPDAPAKTLPSEAPRPELAQPKNRQHILEAVLSGQRPAAAPVTARVPMMQSVPITQDTPATPALISVATAEHSKAPVRTDSVEQKSTPLAVNAMPPGQTEKQTIVPPTGPQPAQPATPQMDELTTPFNDRTPRIADTSRMGETPPQSTLVPTAATTKPAQSAQSKAPVFLLSEMSVQHVQETLARMQGEPTEIIQWDVRTGQTLSTPIASAAPVLARAEMPPNIAGQIAAALQRSGDKPIEIALNPPELGRVRMVLSASETGMVVQVLTDRSDTLDLMRRNIDDLGRALTDLGYDDLSFAFGHSDDGSAPNDERDTEQTTLELSETAQAVTPQTEARPHLAIASSGVDIRI